jgi:hypothetical protein
LTSLDFDTYKSSLKTYLQSQSQFQDWNFDASNFSVLLDILSYNTYQNAFYMNMIASEMFLDTAQLRDSVVLRAKELNYTPRSFQSAVATVNLVVANVPNSPVLLTIPSGTSFSAKAGSNTYTFSTNQNIVLNANTDGNFYATNVSIYEGTYVTDTFVMNPSSNTDYQQFILSNPTIDTSSRSVISVENQGANTIAYLLSTSLLDIKETTAVYFIEGADDSKYKIIFGDNVVGRRPIDNAVILATYRVTNGELPNGISLFTPNGTIGGSSNVTVTTVSSASGGSISENINSIRYNAPKYYATQDRAVTTSDYETLLKVTYPEIQALSVYGGETVTPPQYGKVFIAMKLFNYDNVPQNYITKYKQFLSNRAPLTIIPAFVDPEYTYVSISTIVKYNVNITTLQPTDISAYVTSAIQTYNINSLGNFNVTLLYSKLVEAIDNADTSIVSNQTTYKVMKKLVPSTTSASNYTISFDIALNANIPSENLIYPTSDEHAIISSQFTYNGINCILQDDGSGNMRIVKNNVGGYDQAIVASGVGTVDYTTGTVTLTNFLPQAYIGNSIRIYGQLPYNTFDVSTTKQVLFEIPNDEISVTVVQVRQ